MALVFWLTASVETIARRIGGGNQRPSLTGTKSFVDEIQDVLRERTPKYQAAADHIIVTDGRSINQLMETSTRAGVSMLGYRRCHIRIDPCGYSYP